MRVLRPRRKGQRMGREMPKVEGVRRVRVKLDLRAHAAGPAGVGFRYHLRCG